MDPARDMRTHPARSAAPVGTADRTAGRRVDMARRPEDMLADTAALGLPESPESRPNTAGRGHMAIGRLLVAAGTQPKAGPVALAESPTRVGALEPDCPAIQTSGLATHRIPHTSYLQGASGSHNAGRLFHPRHYILSTFDHPGRQSAASHQLITWH